MARKSKVKTKIDSNITSHEAILGSLKKQVKKNKKGDSVTNKVKGTRPLKTITPPANYKPSKTYSNMVDRLKDLNDVNKLKKILYNRNYSIKKAAEDWRLETPLINDIRYIRKPTWNRLNKIKDPNKLVEELKKLILSTTRRRINPKTPADYSDKEQEYLSKGVNSLQDAVEGWMEGALKRKIIVILNDLSIEEMQGVFETTPSWWAISEGYYYAIAEFDDFVSSLCDLVNSKVEEDSQKLTTRDRNEIKELLFHNDPRK